MDVRWRTGDPDGIAAWLAPFPLANARVVVERSGGGPEADRLAIVETSPFPGPADAPFELLAAGVGTVDTERYAADAGWTVSPEPDDDVLGASVAMVAGPPLLLLEPRSEGRLAAALARAGEGPVALYIRRRDGVPDDPRRGAPAGAIHGRGPFGSQVLVPGRRAWGPHVLLVDAPATIVR